MRMEGVRGRCLLFCIGAAGYSLLEIAWRGHTHWSMTLAGGVCLVGLWAVHRRLTHRPLAVRAAAGAGLITAVEFAVGCVVNRWLGWNVWDYSGHRVQLLGQICLLFCLVWYLISFLTMGLFGRLERRRA